MTIKFAHISDWHLSHDPNKNKIIKDRISSLYMEGFNFLSTGDEMDDATKEQSFELSNICNVGNYIIAPGNHDYCAAGTQVSVFTETVESIKRYQEIQLALLDALAISDNKTINTITIQSIPVDKIVNKKFLWWNIGPTIKKILRVVEIPMEKILILVADSNPIDTLASVGFARGEVGPIQRKKIQSLLKDKKYTGWYKIVMFHHHLTYTDYFLKLIDSDEMLKILWTDCDLVLNGHKHEWNLQSSANGLISFAGSLRSGITPVTTFEIADGKLIKYDKIILPTHS